MRWPAAVLTLAFCLLNSPRSQAANEDARSLQFVIANTQFTLLHELAHVLISELEIPVLGREEDAADELGTVALLRAAGHRDPQVLVDNLTAAADGWLLEWHLEQDAGNQLEYWDSHPLDIQRYYNIVCLMVGSRPDAFAGLQDSLHLPYQRAWRCDDEYRRARKTLQWIDQRYRGTHAHALRKARVGIIYEPPRSEGDRQIYELIRRSRVMEDTARLIEMNYPMPYDVHIVLTNICGATAYWRRDLKEIIVCYRLIDRFIALARLRHCVTGGLPSVPRPEPDSAEIRSCVRETKGSEPLYPESPSLKLTPAPSKNGTDLFSSDRK